MNKQEIEKVDKAAIMYYETKDKKYFEDIGPILSNTIQAHVIHLCIGSSRWDKDELFSILFADMWRLFKVYIPEKDKKFHWLMLKQLGNKSKNYIKNTTGRVYKNCFVCNHFHANKETVCTNCGASLRKPYASTGNDLYDLSYNYTPNYLKDIENKQIIVKLLKDTEDNPKTHRILELLLAGYRRIEIVKELQIAPNAMNSRIKNCQKTLKKLGVTIDDY